MRPDATKRLLWSPRREDVGQRVSSGFTHYYAMFEELSFVRREAQAEANLAWEDWRRRPCADAYAVYLAAQDRADAAQDELANWVRRAPA
jgi:hypothetical protein